MPGIDAAGVVVALSTQRSEEALVAVRKRMAAFCILDFRARRRLDDAERRDLYDVYLTRHDRITTWDMVDRSAPWVVGGWLRGRDLTPLHEPRK